MPRGTAGRRKTRYAVTLTVPRRGGWRAWGAIRSDFEAALADPSDPSVLEAGITSERRRGADYVRVVMTVTVTAADPAEALAVAWEAFREAAAGDRLGWDTAEAAAEVQPAPGALRTA